MLLIQQELKSAYIGEYKYPYTVNEHTLCYLPMSAKTTTTDYWTLGWTWTQNWWNFVDNYYQTTWAENVSRLYTWYNTYSTYSSYTILEWVKTTSASWAFVDINNYWDGDNGNIDFVYNMFNRYNGSTWNISFTAINDGNWHLMVLIGFQWIGYIDGVQVSQTSTRSVSIKPRFVWVNSSRMSTSSSTWWAWCFSNLIIEDRVWTAEEIADYYNASKEFYWIS